MYIKVHQAYRKIVAVCDSDILGKIFEERMRQIEVRPNFFGGEEKTKAEVLEILKEMDREDSTFNIVGKESVETAIEAGIIKPGGVIKIQDVPVALGLL